MFSKSAIDRFACAARNLVSKNIFSAIRRYCRGTVLDVGGWDFYLTILKRPDITFDAWTNLERGDERLPEIRHFRYRTVIGDGEAMSFPDNSFDTALSIQALEHTFQPIRMVREIGRVLKPGGHAIFLIPQTNVMHHPPHHYYNFTRFWIQRAMDGAGLDIVELKPLGGRWKSTASHLFHFFLQSFRSKSYTTSADKRSPLFYLLFPAMAVYALVSIPVCLIFSLGDLTEETDNWLVVGRKRTPPDNRHPLPEKA